MELLPPIATLAPEQLSMECFNEELRRIVPITQRTQLPRVLFTTNLLGQALNTTETETAMALATALLLLSTDKTVHTQPSLSLL